MPFIPTDEQRAKIKEDLSLNIAPDYARLSIIDPDTARPINLKTFYLVFQEEIKKAKFDKAYPMITKYHQMCKDSDNPAVVRQWLNLNCRGMFGQRFELDQNKTPSEQINQVV